MSVIDIIKAMTGYDAHDAAQINRKLLRENPDLVDKVEKIHFIHDPKHPTPVANLPTIMNIIMLVTGKPAAKARVSIARHICRFFSGDQTLHAEIDSFAASDHPLSKLAREAINQANAGNEPIVNTPGDQNMDAMETADAVENHWTPTMNVDPITAIAQMDTPEAVEFRKQAFETHMHQSKQMFDLYMERSKKMNQLQLAELEQNKKVKDEKAKAEAEKSKAEKLRQILEQKRTQYEILKLDMQAKDCRVQQERISKEEKLMRSQHRTKMQKEVTERAEDKKRRSYAKPNPRPRKTKSTSPPMEEKEATLTAPTMQDATPTAPTMQEATPTAHTMQEATVDATRIAELDGPRSYSAMMAQPASSVPQQPAVVQATLVEVLD